MKALSKILLLFIVYPIMVLYIAGAYANDCIRAFTNEEYVDILIKSDQLKYELNTIIKNIDKNPSEKNTMEKRFVLALKLVCPSYMDSC